MSLSIGIFFSLLITGLAATLPRALTSGLKAQGVPASVAAHAAHLPPVSTLFASFLGYNPIATLLRPSGVLGTLPSGNAAALTSKQFFPHLISGPFHHGLVIVFIAAIALSVCGAAVSLLRGRQFYYETPGTAAAPAAPDSAAPAQAPGAPVPALANGRLSGPAVRPHGHQLAGLPRPEAGLPAHPSARNGSPPVTPSSQNGRPASDPAVSQPGDAAG
jgi:hypothetical protein